MIEIPDLRLFLVRHGETELNREHRMQGWSDLPLNERGREQLCRLRERLRDERIDRVVASDLCRARESAEILAGPLGLPVDTDPRLREQNLGDWEGEVWPDLAQVASPGAVERFIGDPDFAPPGGESKSAVRERLFAFLDELRTGAEGETVLLVSHGGPLQVFVATALEIPWSEKKRLYPVNGGLTEFLFVTGYWRLVTFDETAHLRKR